MSRSQLQEFSSLDCLLASTCGGKKNHVLSGVNIARLTGAAFTGFPCASESADAVFVQSVNGKSNTVGNLVLFPTGYPRRPLTAIVSSRLGRKLDEQIAWFRALRSACSRLAQNDRVVVNVTGTTTSRFLPRATALFATARLDVHPASKTITIENWWKSVASGQQRQPISPHTGELFHAYVSPAVRIAEETAAPDSPTQSLCEANRANLAIADLIADRLAEDVLALHVRGNGQIHQILMRRLESTRSSDDLVGTRPRVQLAVGPNLNSPNAQDQLLAAGAVGWYLYPKSSQPAAGFPRIGKATNERENRSSSESHAVLSKVQGGAAKNETNEPYLTHCTRRRSGPWPDQSQDSYLDDLILERDGANHSAFAALERIVAGRELIASATTIRGEVSVVSLTSVPLDELQSLRVFRSHRGHWDFEPYGISIRQAALRRLAEAKQQRLRPVIYASQEEWEQLAEADRVFFQKNHSVTRSGNIMDWTAEQEWRFVGDIDLSSIKPNDAVVFVRTQEEATDLRLLSPWPVIALR